MQEDPIVLQIVDRHIAAFTKGDVSGVMADYADNAVLITKATGIIKGKPAISETFKMILSAVFPPGTTELKFEPVMTSGEVALLHWSAVTPTIRTAGAFDSFVIQNGKIVAQTGGGDVIAIEPQS